MKSQPLVIEEWMDQALVIKENNFKIWAIESVKKGYFHSMTKSCIASYNLEIVTLFSDTKDQCFISSSKVGIFSVLSALMWICKPQPAGWRLLIVDTTHLESAPIFS